MKKAVGFLLIAAALAVFGYYWWENVSMPPEEAGEIAPPVSVRRPTQETLRRELRLSGTVEADNTVTVLPKVAGEISAIPVREGDRVRQGDVIAAIDDEQYAPRATEAESALAAAQSSFERIRSLYNSGSATEQELEEARARLESAQSQARLAELQLQYTDIEAPISGTVLSRNASIGQTVSRQSPIVTIATTELLKVTVDVSEQYYTRVAGGETAGIQVGVPAVSDNRLAARIQTVAPYVSARTKTFELTVQLTGNTELVRPGMYADVYVVLSEIEAPALPIEALVGGSELWYVDDGETARAITLSQPQTNDDWVAVPAEHAGRSFIVEGQHFLREGQPVQRLRSDDGE